MYNEDDAKGEGGIGKKCGTCLKGRREQRNGTSVQCVCVMGDRLQRSQVCNQGK